MPSLEDQLAAAIKSQNDLTQAVAAYKSQIDASIATMTAQTAEALKTNRIYTDGNITRARSLIHCRGLNGDGLYKIKTPIDMESNTMVRFDIKGYSFDESKIIDLSVNTYVYGAVKAPDGTNGYFSYNSAQRLGNSSKSSIWLGEDPLTGNACLVFGTPKAKNYYFCFSVDATFFFGPMPSFDKKDWKVELDNSDAPSASEKTGFGLINLFAL